LIVRLFIAAYFAVLALLMAFGKPEEQISTGVHQPFALDPELGCLAEDVDMIEYRRLKYACKDPPAHLPELAPQNDPDGQSKNHNISHTRFSISIILDQNETLLLRNNYDFFARKKVDKRRLGMRGAGRGTRTNYPGFTTLTPTFRTTAGRC